MYEIEAKVPLMQADFQRLKKEIQKIARHKEAVDIKDSYYYFSKNRSLRVRKKNQENQLNIKNRRKEQGIELNQEMEFPLTSASGFHNFLKKIGIPLSIKKQKKGDYYHYKNFQIELHNVAKLGYFLEIETIIHSKSEIPKAKKALRELFSQLGFSPKDFEKRSYLQLLTEKVK